MEGGVKFGKGNVTPPRERPYWESPRSAIGKTDAYIEEIGPGRPPEGPEGPEKAAPARGEWLSQKLWQHRAVVVVGLVVLVALAAVGVDGSLSSRQPKPGPSNSDWLALSSGSSPAGSTLGGSSVSPSPTQGLAITWTAAPGDTTQPVASPTPLFANGWPVTFSESDPNVNLSRLVVGPDGGVYIQGLPALDSHGNVRTGWPQLAQWDSATLAGFGPDGTIYATAGDPFGTNARLEAFSADGRQKPGWDLDFGDSPRFEIGPAGTVYAFSDVDSVGWVTVLDSAGRTKARWSLGSDVGGSCGDVIRPDGTLFYCHGTQPQPTFTVDVYGPTGHLMSDNLVGGWSRLALSPDGLVYAVGFDYEPYSNSVVAQTRIAVIGTDGKPAPGWPIAFEGSASPPAFGPDGTIYVAHAGLGTGASQIAAYDRSGNLKAGWPVSLPKGLGTLADAGGNPSAPVVGSNGYVFEAATNTQLTGLIIGYDPSGKILPGWPYSMPRSFAMAQDPFKSGQNPGPVFVKSPAGQGSLYLILDGEIVALGIDGSVGKGWPYQIPASASAQSYWVTWAASPDGGLVAVSVSNGDVVPVATIIRLNPDGSFAR
jgi:hypothetical protein